MGGGGISVVWEGGKGQWVSGFGANEGERRFILGNRSEMKMCCFFSETAHHTHIELNFCCRQSFQIGIRRAALDNDTVFTVTFRKLDE